MLMEEDTFWGRVVYVRGTRNHTLTAIEEILGRGDIDVCHRAVAVAPYLIEVHADFETEDRAFWFTFTQDCVLTVHRHSKNEYRREKFSVPFEELDAEWLRSVLLGQ